MTKIWEPELLQTGLRARKPPVGLKMEVQHGLFPADSIAESGKSDDRWNFHVAVGKDEVRRSRTRSECVRLV